MSVSSSPSLSIFPNPPTLHKPRTILFASTFPFASPSKSSATRTLVCFAAQFDRDESLWLREEQRWLREEQRWLREEQRWARERDALLRRVAELELQIQAMDRQSSVDTAAEVTDAISGLIEVLKEKSMIAEASSSASPVFLEEKEKKRDEEVEDEVLVERVIRVVSEEEPANKLESKLEPSPKKMEKKKRRSLKQGSEGDEVRALQEALQKLGFYSGEEDIEYSSFSTGTERAVKTWQSSLGAHEDGIMTEELLERLFMGEEDDSGSITDMKEKANLTPKPKEDGNGAAASSSSKQLPKTQQSSVKEGKGVSEPKYIKPRVFLLGENRWEDSSRLGVSNNKPKQSTNKCIACRGEGRLLCTECDGTGEPNIEPQFMEWVEEGTTCPYCEGLGYTICDVCSDKSGV